MHLAIQACREAGGQAPSDHPDLEKRLMEDFTVSPSSPRKAAQHAHPRRRQAG
jgi:hypothetical protein